MADVDILPMKTGLQMLTKIVPAMAVAHHVAADADFGARRRLQEKVRIETGDRLQPEERDVETFGEGTELALGQKAVRPLDAAELVEDG